nr:hypothetical protein [uncultured Pseudomonas sp.]
MDFESERLSLIVEAIDEASEPTESMPLLPQQSSEEELAAQL